MSRPHLNIPRHFNTPGHAHALTFTCFKNKPLLRIDTACSILADSINKYRFQYNYEVWAYVFMPDHVHLLIYPKSDEYSISAILKSIKQSSARQIIGYLKREEPSKLRHLETGQRSPKYRFWQRGGGYDRNYHSDAEISKVIEYIHNNPVRSGLVSEPDEWEWSSAGYWLNGEAGRVIIETTGMLIM